MASQFSKMDRVQLQEELSKFKRGLFNLKLQKSMGQLERPTIMKGVRRDIARIKTFLTLTSADNVKNQGKRKKKS